MPYQTVWIAPELFLEYRGVKVFNTYRDDDYDQGACTWWFTTDESGESGSEFDVRTLAVPSQSCLDKRPPALTTSTSKEAVAQWLQWYGPGGVEETAIRKALCEAIDLGLITAP